MSLDGVYDVTPAYLEGVCWYDRVMLRECILQACCTVEDTAWEFLGFGKFEYELFKRIISRSDTIRIVDGTSGFM